VIASRDELDRRVVEFTERFDGAPVPRPPFWSGFRVVPERIEFWTGRTGRLHDRERYDREGGAWRVSLLAP
jgi:pyridoxamine 5'-phosphate oxidase